MSRTLGSNDARHGDALLRTTRPFMSIAPETSHVA